MSKPPENVRGAFVACKWQLELQGLLKKQQTNKQTIKQTKEIDNFVQFDWVTFIIFKETKY